MFALLLLPAALAQAPTPALPEDAVAEAPGEDSPGAEAPPADKQTERVRGDATADAPRPARC
jgi:hypothetical protein